MPDGLGQLSAASGLSRQELVDLAAKVRINHHNLESCKRHQFELIPNTEVPGFDLRRRFRCVRCLGEIDAVAHRWYQLGREHERSAN